MDKSNGCTGRQSDEYSRFWAGRLRSRYIIGTLVEQVKRILKQVQDDVGISTIVTGDKSFTTGERKCKVYLPVKVSQSILLDAAGVKMKMGVSLLKYRI